MNLVSGKWQPGSGSEWSIVSPHTGAELDRVRASTREDIHDALQAATGAFQKWGKTTPKERAAVLYRFREELLKLSEDIAKSASAESGKTVAEGKAGLMKGIEVLEFALSLQNSDSGGRVQVSQGVFCEYRREPLGVVAAITPFNFPAMVPLWMIPISLATGNCLVWKPSDKTPLTSYWLGEAARRAGIPDGVFTILQGGRSTVEQLIDHPAIRAIGFVGSTPVAQLVFERGNKLGKRVLALGGAKNPVILLPDADPALATRGITDSYTGCAGQRCMAASVLLAVGNCDSMIQGIVEKSRSMELGRDMGALISGESKARLDQAIERAVQAGAKILLDGRKATIPAGCEKGFWLGPTILDQVKPGTQAACDELFGPILSIIRVATLTEALAWEAANPYGNACSVFTQSGPLAERVANEATAGMIGINIGVPVPREPFSFGGSKQSKFGVGDITGNTGVEFWTQLKKVTTKWVEASDRTWMS